MRYLAKRFSLPIIVLLSVSFAGAAVPRGYNARPCGFDMDRNGIIGEANDAHVGDGVTADPDGDGTNEDILYVDGYTGNDTTGDGSAGNPYKTIQKALDMADGSGDGAEDIIAIYGTFKEAVTLSDSGVAGYYVRDNFQFPNNPLMIIGWDKDNDGEYPPYDTDDEAVLDGNVSANLLDWAIQVSGKRSYIEIAHLEITNYGSGAWSSAGAMRLFNSGSELQSHIYVHDVEMSNINRAYGDKGTRIVLNWWGGPRSHVAIINNQVDEYGSYFVRGSPQSPSTKFRFQNLSLKMFGSGGTTSSDFTIGWKLWETHSNVEIIDNIIDANPRAYNAQNWNYAIAICQCARNYVVRNNEFIDCLYGVITQGDAGSNACRSRTVDDILIDRNIFRLTYDWPLTLPLAIDIRGGALTTATTENITITNNFIWSDNENDPNVGWYAGVNSQVGNDAGTQPGTVTIAGNTIWGLRENNNYTGPCFGIKISSNYTYKQQNFVIKNNIFNKMYSTGNNYNIEVNNHAPGNFVANGNVYDAKGAWEWDGIKYTSLSAWQAATGEDANSVTGYPLFVDAANGDLHLDANDTVAKGFGVDITSITDHDIDGDARVAATPMAGADVATPPATSLPAPWINADVGSPPSAGSADYADGNWTATGSGTIYNTADSFHFIYQPYNGDLSIVASVQDVNSAFNPWAAGGVMIRETLNADSKSAFMAVSHTAQGGLIYDYRRTTGGSTTETMVAGGEPQWVKLERIGGTIYGYHSNDGSSWTQVDAIAFNMTDSVYVGFAVAENDVGGPTEAQFQNLSANPIIPLYALTVNSGSGDGNYEANTIVNIVADAPGSEQSFDVWTGDTAYVADVNEPNTTVTMPATNVTVTATYVSDPNAPVTYTLTVNNGSGDGNYVEGTVVNISADGPGTGQVFDAWTGDTTNIAATSDPNTTITMPAADSQITATFVDDPNNVAPDRGYTARPCGFDMDRNGIIGEANDQHVGDGVTSDPDFDGTDEDILYVDGYTGNDTTGDGSAGNPYKTVQKALDMADGPGDGAEDIIAIYGTFKESLTIKDSGLEGYYVRDNFQFPNNPLMLIGWDKDNDGQYPPFDTDDEAVLNGDSSLALAISNPNGNHRLEIAHLTIKDYGVAGGGDRGAMKLRGAGSDQRHIYVHDVELLRICKGMPTSGGYIIFSLFSSGAKLHYFAITNTLFDEFGSFGFRGSGSGSGNYRFQNLTMKMYGVPGDTSWTGAPSGWKLWDENSHIEILDCIIDGNPSAFLPTGYTSGIAVCQGSQDWTIRNNELIDIKSGITLQPDAGDPHYRERPVTRIVIDRNIYRNTYAWQWSNSTQAVKLQSSYDPAPATTAVGEVTITNNFFSSTVPYMAIYSNAGNASATPAGTVTIAGNTIYGPSDYGAIWLTEGRAYPKDDFVVKNNIIANVGKSYKNINASYAPANWVANGNVYDADHPSFVWNGSNIASLAAWQAATGQDAGSKVGDPNFVNAASGDLHLAANDTVAKGFGVDITSITNHDIDGDARNASVPTAGADVVPPPADTDPPTIAAWVSSATHGRGVGEALLLIPDDGSFCEPRSSGISKLMVIFTEAMDPLNFTPTNVEIAGLDANGDPVNMIGVVIATTLITSDLIGEITFTPALPDYAKYIVRIVGATDVAGNTVAGDNDRIITALIGDASGDLRVNTADLSVIRGARTKRISSGSVDQIRADVSLDGRINVSDLSLIRARNGNNATAIADPAMP